MKLQHGLGDLYVILPGNGLGLYSSSQGQHGSCY